MTNSESNQERTGALRPLLWLVLVVSAAANAVASTSGDNIFLGAAFGLVTLACATGLVVHHYRGRTR
ncbi:hypothetical protein Asp14428_08760 [Actinoplanes sp. NBRC 14428]|uniref:Uncharacterized protein n=1 Tax=Pseudosporangium ferrugineum TaxID=439699 RepID=A0A2T0SG13_9ACTN|nr:hypothetical protein [Pseudosporangium ferrugineum]PRY32351.1 hypothetical protein CLV70_102562 [Pseudosporangium ferrugineum]BCJ49401.1 hypothetical protein Asp14428_08760 [Actinoplanes sp. NBRC 14428]